MKKKTATKLISKLVFTPVKESDYFALKFKKGDYMGFNNRKFKWFPFPHLKKQYAQTDLYYPKFLGIFAGDSCYTKQEIDDSQSEIFFIEDKVYKKAKVKITYIDKEQDVYYFKTNDEALNKYNELKTKLDLIEI